MDAFLVVCDFVENSLADITFSLGEAILDVDGEKVTTCTAFNDRVRKSLEIRNFCLILVEIPSTDPLKNLLRNQISKAIKDGGRVNRIPPDAASFAAEGVNIFKRFSNEPLKSVWTGEKHMKTCESANRLKLEDKVKETDVPAGWNSRLFVRLPPMKTLESETLPQ
uniref:ILEI domain-containing protein n=1 Tax=Caenorhabditis tropicalis TaxID=1561998 RepID=A0A1I7TXH3_9PELO